MGINELLFWLSANGSGSWGRFRSAAEELVPRKDGRQPSAEGLRIHQRIRFGLQQLGHVEFGCSGCEGGWRVAPPVLALSERNGGMAGILCGARLPKLIATIADDLAKAHFERVEGIEQPDVVRFFAKDADVVNTAAQRARARVQMHAPISMISCLPRITDLSGWHTSPSELPFGKHVTVERFELTKTMCRWGKSSVEEAKRANEGLFRFTRYERREHYLHSGGRTLLVPGQLGNFVIAAKHRRRLIRYSRATKELTFPDVCRPPLLIDRALVLCSGFLPRHEVASRTLTYIDVPETTAAQSAALLCQEYA